MAQRARRVGLGLGFAIIAMSSGALFNACSGGATPNAGPGDTTGGGIGDPCGAGNTCRAGLVCSDTSICAASGTAATGAACKVGDECNSGICGSKRTCDASGAGVAGSSCAGDDDCSKGLRCGFDGVTLFPKCLPEGKADFGKACSATKDCLEGLYCESGKCIDPPVLDAGKGIPPFIPSPSGTPWPGATCAAPKKAGSVSALFNVPGSVNAAKSDDKDFFSLPFPNDAARKGSRVSYDTFPHDPTPPMGFDVVKLYLDALADQPFGNDGTTILRFDGEFDFSTIDIALDKPTPDAPDPGLRLVDLSGASTDPLFGGFLGLNIFVSTGRNKYLCPDSLSVRPNAGAPFKPGGRYAVILKTGVKDCPLPKKKNAAGDEVCGDGPVSIAPSPDLVALLGATAPSDPALTDAYASYAPLRDYLTLKKIGASSVLNASVFTVGAPPVPAARMFKSVAADVAPVASGWTLCKSGVKSPCPQADGDRGCGVENPAFDELHALVELPIFQKGTAPYLSSKDGGDIDLAGDASTPIAKVRTEQVCLGLTVPKGTAPASGWPIAIYAHGTGGSFRSHAIDGTSAMLSNIDLGGLGVGFAVLGIDQIGHGPRRCGGGSCTSTVSPDDVVFNFGNPQAARFNYLQAAADQHALVRLLETLTIDAGPTGTAIAFDPSKTVYFGHSQGATAGALFLSADPTIHGAVLSGEGGSLIEALLSKTSPVDLPNVLWIALSESSPGVINEFHPVLSLLQNWVDPSDPLYFARLDALPAVSPAFPRNVFQPSGTSDTYTPFAVQFPFAIEGGFAFVDPILDTKTPPNAFAMGNIVLGSVASTAAFRQYTPSGYDGHFVAFKNDQAKTDVSKFLARVAAGVVPKLPE